VRRAELAGREDAEKWINGPTFGHRIAPGLRTLPEFKPHTLFATSAQEFHLHIGAHQLSGRALQAAYDAYDRGYRARVKEALEAK
jgi:hypothetical protein